jgi:hypothetical protein
LGEGDHVNLYADYYPQGERVEVYCVVKYADGSDSEEIMLSDIFDSEKEAILGHMRKAGLDELIAEMQSEALEDLPQPQKPDFAKHGDGRSKPKAPVKDREAR